VETNDTARQATDDSIMWHRKLCFPCQVTKARTQTRSSYIILIFHGNSGYANVPQCCIICTLPVCLPFCSIVRIMRYIMGFTSSKLAFVFGGGRDFAFSCRIKMDSTQPPIRCITWALFAGYEVSAV
jgi:hypothetical protein